MNYSDIDPNGISFVSKEGVVYTYADVLKQFSDGFLTQMLTISIMLLLFDLYVLEFTSKWNLPGWRYVLKHPEKKSLVRSKILRGAAMACLPVNLFFLVLIIGYKTGWYI